VLIQLQELSLRAARLRRPVRLYFGGAKGGTTSKLIIIHQWTQRHGSATICCVSVVYDGVSADFRVHGKSSPATVFLYVTAGVSSVGQVRVFPGE
jgi:hypothetical protein